MATPWVILSRIVRTSNGPGGAAAGAVAQEQHAAAALEVAQEQHVAAVLAVEQAQHDAVAGAVAQERHAAAVVAVAQERHAAAAVAVAQERHAAAAVAVAVAQAQAQLAAAAGQGAQAQQDAVAEAVAQERRAAAAVAAAQERHAAAAVAAAQERHAAAVVAVAPEQHAAATGQGAQAPQDAAADSPDFTLAVAQPPRVTVLAAGRRAHPEPDSPDKYPYIIAAGSHCLLVHFSVEPFYSIQFNDLHDSHLVVVRYFHTAEGRTTTSAECLPDRFGPIPNLSSIGNVVLATNNRGGYLVANLEVFRGSTSATLTYCHQSNDHTRNCLAGTRPLTHPLADDNDREWIPHGAVSVDGTLWWFDLTWGILSYKASLSDTNQDLVFHELPGDRELHDEPPPHIHTKRCVTASRGKLRYVEIITYGEAAARVCMWSRSRTPPDGDDWQWHLRYEVSFEEIWDGDSYKATGLPRDVPLLLVVCPSDPDLVYFTLEQRIFGVNVPAHTVLHHDGEAANMPMPGPDPISGLYAVAWDLPPEVAQALRPRLTPLELFAAISLVHLKYRYGSQSQAEGDGC